MNEQEVAARLVSDVQANLAWLQFGVLSVGCILMIVSTILFVRAYSALSEARIIYAELNLSGHKLGKPRGHARRSTPENINKAADARKPIANRRRTLP